jgi:plasmid replication initiation protein
MEKNAIIVKSNALIETSYQLSLNEQIIVLACISQVRRNEPVTDDIMYSISATEFATLCESNPKVAYRDLKSAALKLNERRVRITKYPNGKGNRKRVLATGWVQSVEYADGDGLVSLRFNRDILPYLSELKQCFTSYQLKNVVHMSSSYGARLYELLMQWKEVGERDISIDWIRNNFLLEKKYPQMSDFKKRVLDPAVKDINKHSDLWVKWQQKKTGAKVTHLKFKFGLKENQKTKPPKPEIKIQGVEKSIIEKDARPGETYEQAALRIKKLKSTIKEKQNHKIKEVEIL